MLILDKIKLRRINIFLESWENVCELVESTIHDGNIACEKRWFTSENLLSFLDFPPMDPTEDALSPKIKLEQVEREFLKTKEQIEKINNLHVA